MNMHEQRNETESTGPTPFSAGCVVRLEFFWVSRLLGGFSLRRCGFSVSSWCSAVCAGRAAVVFFVPLWLCLWLGSVAPVVFLPVLPAFSQKIPVGSLHNALACGLYSKPLIFVTRTFFVVIVNLGDPM